MKRESHDLAGVAGAAFAGGGIGFAGAFIIMLVVAFVGGVSAGTAVAVAVFSGFWGGGIIGATVGASRAFALARA